MTTMAILKSDLKRVLKQGELRLGHLRRSL
jgi:hypothetical protein